MIEATQQGERDSFKDLDERASGVLQKFRVREEEIYIEVNPQILFCANVEEIDGARMLILDIITTDTRGNRHPYFERHSASELATRAIKYFDGFGELRDLEFLWHNEYISISGLQSSNYQKHIGVRNAALAEGIPEDEARKRAVMATWTFQRIAAPNGFKTIVLDKLKEIGSPVAPTSV